MNPPAETIGGSALGYFVAAKIAAALGITKRRVLSKLGTQSADGELIVNGQAAPAWRIASLPAAWREQIAKAARARGYRDSAAMLAAPPRLWLPKLALGEIAARHVEKAVQLKRALSAPLARLNDLRLEEAEFRALGVRDYAAVFGRAISEKQWRRLLNRTLARDGGAEDWERLEIYLEENCSPAKPTPSACTVQTRAEQQPLAALIASFANPISPTETEKLLLWQSVFDRHEDMIAAGGEAKAVRLSLLKFLQQHAPFLAENGNALRVAFDRKLERWKAGDGRPQALADRRSEANAARRKELPEEDRKALLAFASKFGGGISQGWREARRRGALGLEIASGHIENPRNKSYVPQSVRNILRHDHAMLDDEMHGPRTAKLGGAFIERDPNSFAAGDWFQGDDATLPNYFYEETERGVRLMRGQFLGMIDCRTTHINGFVLISAELDRPSSYNAWHIRNLITRVHDTYGLPRKGFYFENGTWRSKLLTGGTSWGETEIGLREFGVQFKHARLPRAKVIERVFGSLQNYLEAELGYVGRNEQVEKYERVQRHIALVRSGRAPAHEHFLSRDEWVERLEQICAQYNAETQSGKYLPGLSPAQGYEQFHGDEPQVRLPDSARYLLANELKKLRVGQNGISFTSRGERFTYKSEETGRLRGREVQVFFNYESPESVGVKEPATGEAFAVRRATRPDAFDADAETMSQAHAENADHEAYRRALYRSIVPSFSEHFTTKRIFRAALVDAATAEAGARIAADVERQTAEAREEAKAGRELTKAGDRLGMKLRPGKGRDDERLEAARDLELLRAKARQMKEAEAQPQN